MCVSDPGAAQRVASLTTAPTLFPVPKPTLMAKPAVPVGWVQAPRANLAAGDASIPRSTHMVASDDKSYPHAGHRHQTMADLRSLRRKQHPHPHVETDRLTVAVTQTGTDAVTAFTATMRPSY